MSAYHRNLLALLEKKIVLYDKFIIVLQSEWEFTVGYKLAGMEKMLWDKEALVERMQRMDKDRSLLMDKIAETMGIPGSKLTLKKLIESKSSPYNEKLARCRAKLLSRISKINNLMDRTKRLMHYSSLSLKKSLAFVHAADEMAAAPYHSNGRLREGKIQGRMLSMDV